MSIVFDKLQFQNNTHFGETNPIVAEIGVEVTTIPTEIPSDDGGCEYEDVPLKVDPGYYYVAVISKVESVGGIGMEDWGKTFLVSKESVFEYVYGFANEDEPPEYIETYDRIADAAESDFLNYFLLINQMIDASRHDQAGVIKERREKALASDIETSIRIDQINRISIISRALTNDTDKTEVRCEITLDEESDSVFFEENKCYISPRCWYMVSSEKGILEKHFTMDRAYDTRYFSCFVELERVTKERLCSYFEREQISLEKRFGKEGTSTLKTGILGVALGIKEYM